MSASYLSFSGSGYPSFVNSLSVSGSGSYIALGGAGFPSISTSFITTVAGVTGFSNSVSSLAPSATSFYTYTVSATGGYAPQ